MSKHRIDADLGGYPAGRGYVEDGSLGRPGLIQGNGAPSDTDDVGMLYIRLDSTTGDNTLYTWDSTAGVWDVMTA